MTDKEMFIKLLDYLNLGYEEEKTDDVTELWLEKCDKTNWGSLYISFNGDKFDYISEY